MAKIITFPNILSLLRIPLALLLFSDSVTLRAAAILIAACSDFLDGFLARRFGQGSQLGVLLDPFTDKFFVGVALAIFFFEGKMTFWQLAAFLTRDISLALFTTFHYLRKTLFTIQSFWSGKVTTTFQFITLLVLCLNIPCPRELFIAMAFTGALTIPELSWLVTRQQKVS